MHGEAADPAVDRIDMTHVGPDEARHGRVSVPGSAVVPQEAGAGSRTHPAPTDRPTHHESR